MACACANFQSIFLSLTLPIIIIKTYPGLLDVHDLLVAGEAGGGVVGPVDPQRVEGLQGAGVHGLQAVVVVLVFIMSVVLLLVVSVVVVFVLLVMVVVFMFLI